MDPSPKPLAWRRSWEGLQLSGLGSAEARGSRKPPLGAKQGSSLAHAPNTDIFILTSAFQGLRPSTFGPLYSPGWNTNSRGPSAQSTTTQNSPSPSVLLTGFLKTKNETQGLGGLPCRTFKINRLSRFFRIQSPPFPFRLSNFWHL